jgi:hypothetical protein
MGLTFNLGRISPSVFTDSSLNVGIGAAPSGTYKLEVTGTAKVSSTLLLGGALTGTSATFSGNLEVFNSGAGQTAGDFIVNPTTKYVYVGRQSTTSGDNTTFVVRDRTGTARATIPGGGSIDTVFSTNSSNFIVTNYSATALMTIANSGAATFSSSVTAASFASNATSALVYSATNAATFYNIVTLNNLNAVATGINSLIAFEGAGTQSNRFGMVQNADGYGDFVFNTYGTGNVRSNKMVILGSSGNVGIGTSSPSEKLHLYNNTAGTATTLLIENNVNNQNSQINFKSIYGGSTAKSFLIGSNISVAAGSWEIYDATAAAARLVITSAGKINIGTTTNNGVMVFPRTSENIALSTYDNNTLQLSTLLANTGNLRIEGSLSKGSGSFRIDHPLESMTETHQLVHSFVEAPQADLYYRGKLTLVNGKGQASIDEVSSMTKGTFEALCREVQCFTTNESGWDLIKGKVVGNIIYIESQNTNSTDEISWMVIGERKDKHMMDTEWTDENGKVIVEPLKSIQELNERLNKAGL